MKTQTKRFARLRELFEKAVELTPENRKLFLDQECHDPVLRKELDNVLAADLFEQAHTTDGMRLSVREAFRTANTSSPYRNLCGAILGSYKLLSVLGSGGSGVVYLAERADRRFSAQVAIKVVEAASAYDDLLRRFNSERQILANLNHPNIARLIDAGETPEHFPYLVMEYVHGVSIDRYCDEQKLKLAERLELFLKVCDAVQYAHQNLVVHRDLKPSNILISNGGVPKLLDFGIAKLLASGSSAVTRLQDCALTPEYASPEQIAGRAITTASDVYSLGVVLYELLAGVAPYKISTRSNLELEQAICVVDPPRPSTAVQRLAVHSNPAERQLILDAAAARDLTLSKLSAELSGDVDAIVMRALRKEPEARYASIEQFAADIRRHLALEPVLARNGNWLYYGRRFLSRNLLPASLAGMLLVVLIASVAAIIDQARSAREERDRATRAQQSAERAKQVSERVSAFLDAAFEHVDPYMSKGREVSALDFIDSARNQLNDLNDEPEVRARLLKQFGHAYQRLGHYEKAVVDLQSAVSIERQLYASSDPTRFALTLTQLAIALRSAGDFAASETNFNEAVRLMSAQRQQRTADYAELLREMGRLEHTRGDLAKAEEYYTESIQLRRGLKDTKDTDIAVTLSELSAVFTWKGNLARAEQTAREALSIYEKTVPPTNPDRILVERELGNVFYFEGKIDQAAILINNALTAQRVVYLNAGPQLAQSLDMLAWVRVAQSRYAEAEALLREALENSERFLGMDHYETGFYRTSLAGILYQRKKYKEANMEAREALEVLQKTLPADHQYIASAEHWLGESLMSLGKYSEAKLVLTDALEIWQRAKAKGWLAARTESALGEALVSLGDTEQGIKRLRTALQVLRNERGESDSATVLASQRLAAAVKH